MAMVLLLSVFASVLEGGAGAYQTCGFADIGEANIAP
jgi:hypothetical protein